MNDSFSIIVVCFVCDVGFLFLFFSFIWNESMKRISFSQVDLDVSA